MGSSSQKGITVSVRLDDINYPTWSFLMRHCLRGHGLLKFVDGSYPCPSQFQEIDNHDTDPYEFWLQQDSFAVSMIIDSLSPGQE